MLSQLDADILRFESANDRYARLQQHFPEITKRAPLTMIASYLPDDIGNIKQSTFINS